MTRPLAKRIIQQTLNRGCSLNLKALTLIMVLAFFIVRNTRFLALHAQKVRILGDARQKNQGIIPPVRRQSDGSPTDALINVPTDSYPHP